MENSTFTQADRKELMRHGFQLDQLIDNQSELKKKVDMHDGEIRVLQDSKLVAVSQIRIVALIGGLAATLVNILIKILWNK